MRKPTVRFNSKAPVAILLSLGTLLGGCDVVHLSRLGSGRESGTAHAAPYTLPPAQDHVAPPASDVQVLKSFSKVFVNIAKQTRPALVYIETEEAPRRRAQSPFPEGFFFGFPQQERAPRRGAGSGFLVDLKNGYVITNNHVAGSAGNVNVTTFDNRRFKARLVGADKATDIAVLKLENFTPNDLKAVAFGESEAMEVGDWVVALGAPFGLPQTLTTGVVSAVGRGDIIGDRQSLEDFIQTDAAINPGNSGGPLLNLEGKVIGVNTAISSPTGAYAGIGFAVPSHMAKMVTEMLISEGKVTRGYLGLKGQSFDDLSPELLQNLNSNASRTGALVAEVEPGGPADKAGLKPYDVIVKVNGQSLANFSQLRNRVAFSKPGTELALTVSNGGKEREVKVKVGAVTQDPTLVSSQGGQPGNDEGARGPSREFGMALSPVTPEMRNRFGLRVDRGVVVTGVEEGSNASRLGIEPGDVILEIDRRSVKNSSDVDKALSRSTTQKKDILVLLERDKRQQLLVLRMS